MLVKEAPGQQILFKTTHITDTSLNVTISCCKCFNQEKWLRSPVTLLDYNDVIMSVMASQITSLTIVYSTVYSRRRSKKTSKLRVTGHKGPVTRKMFPFDDVIMNVASVKGGLGNELKHLPVIETDKTYSSYHRRKDAHSFR